MSILIVDDSQDELLLLERILNNGGYKEIIIAMSAGEAFDILKLGDSSSADASVDLILMDVLMPEIDGIEACSRIKGDERLKDIPIVILTASSDVEKLHWAFSAGAVDFITKPYNKVELLARVRSVLSLKHEMDKRKTRERELEELNKTLSEHIEHIKTLRGLIPICASCKKIRDEKGYWESVEEYVSRHSEAEFTHSICDVCMEKLYPDYYRKQQNEKE